MGRKARKRSSSGMYHVVTRGLGKQILFEDNEDYYQYIHILNKYSRTGSLFQERYKSEPVEDESYFKTVFRYILNSSEKAQICPFDNYPWSSYKEYADNACLEHNTRRITDTEAIHILKKNYKR